MPESKNYILFTHYNPEITTVDALISDKNSKVKGWSVGGLMGYKYPSDNSSTLKTNLERIYDLYTPDDYTGERSVFEAAKASDIAAISSLPSEALISFVPKYNILKLGTTLAIPENRLQDGVVITRNDKIISGNLKGLIMKGMQDLIKDSAKSIFSVPGYREESPDITVWLYSKSLSNTSDHLSGKLINLTPFIIDLNTSKSKIDGTFHLQASITEGELAGTFFNQGWGNVLNSEFYSDYSISSKYSDSTLVRTEIFLNKIIGTHDIIFIRFESLESEKRLQDYDMSSIMIENTILSGKVYDMIGVVTGHSVSTSGDEVTLSISGGDLGMILNNDGSSIYSQIFIRSGGSTLDANFKYGMARFQGKYISTFQLQDQYVKDQVLFTLDYQTRIKICDGLFDSYLKGRKLRFPVPGGSLINSPIDGIWKIVDVATDDFVSNLKSFNSQIGNSYDSIISQLSRMCIEPLVELSTDMIGDMFYIMLRRPPFDRAGIESMINSGLVMTITDDDIVSENLSFDDTAYSWYKLDHKYISMFLKDSTKWLIPAIYFDEYAEIWGDKPFRAEDPYIDLTEKANGIQDGVLGKNIITQAVYDLKYIIESNAYLPFTRKGTISTVGDRRIKRGMWIFNSSSGELMYVDNVNQSFSINDKKIDRSTSISVSRCFPISVVDDMFNIISMPVGGFTGLGDSIKFIENTLSTWKLDRIIFNKLLRRKYGIETSLKIRKKISAESITSSLKLKI